MIKCLRAQLCLFSPDGTHCPDPSKGRLRHDSECYRMMKRRQEQMLEPDGEEDEDE